MEFNKTYNIDCISGMKQLPDGIVDLCLTSPPYDDLRTYKGYVFDFETIAKEIYRLIKDGGVLVWVVGDATINGDETGTSFKQALYFKEIGFRLHDTMIYKKTNPNPSGSSRYINCFEYMFVLSKGKPKTFNPLLQPAKDFRVNGKKCMVRKKDGTQRDKYQKTNAMVVRQNIFEYSVGLYNTTADKFAFSHPAMFPEQLAEDQIKSWSNEGDLVLDPFMGSGTSGKMAKILGRNFIGFEVAKDYCDIANKRTNEVEINTKLMEFIE
jgi:site-specific DNA-methyltransferase (adenine-specific)